MKKIKWISYVLIFISAFTVVYQTNQRSVENYVPSVATANAQEIVPDVKPVGVVANPEFKMEEARSLGDPNAPIRMFVFSSLSCSHCSSFHTDVLPVIEEEYVNNGQVYMTYIDFPFQTPAMAGSMLARCVPPEHYFSFLNLLFKNQSKWAFKGNAVEILIEYASTEGLSKADVNKCLSNAKLRDQIVSDRDSYMKKYNVTGTPTVALIKGEETKVISGSSKSKIKSAIEGMLK